MARGRSNSKRNAEFEKSDDFEDFAVELGEPANRPRPGNASIFRVPVGLRVNDDGGYEQYVAESRRQYSAVLSSLKGVPVANTTPVRPQNELSACKTRRELFFEGPFLRTLFNSLANIPYQVTIYSITYTMMAYEVNLELTGIVSKVCLRPERSVSTFLIESPFLKLVPEADTLHSVLHRVATLLASAVIARPDYEACLRATRHRLITEQPQPPSPSKAKVLPTTTAILGTPRLKWKVFQKQEEALQFSKTAKGGLMTFAFESQDRNGRLFLSAHPRVFWHYDVQRPASERSTYEIVTEHAVCKLYADLEFDKNANPSVDGTKLVDEFVNIVRGGLRRFWNVDCPLERILNLDSSNESKFSRHLIFDTNFTNNYHVGAFLKFLFSEPDALGKMAVVGTKGNRASFCDLSVYSKNRHFRLFRSTKKGKNSPFVVSDDCRFPQSTESDVFLFSLITNTTEGRVLEWKGEILKSDRSGPKICVQNVLPARVSPFPILDDHINKIVSPGRIFSSAYFPASRIIVFSIVGNRYCGNIGRQHKSNNVKYIVDLDRYEIYQKCFDYDCKDYRSPPTMLPSEIIFQIEDGSDLFVDCSGALGVFELIDEAGSDAFGTFECDSNPSNADRSGTELGKFPSFGLADDAFENVDY
ncbi:unnamed protein product [Nesidiocoris tenuis]|uniref:DNA-directed primase/polymerase protein n=1 Tax=Nesidiocoris tenuis TaxID=355587 RepID=A0A6H5GJT6_9HEMI|nr:unnamed protein product [Nesidiocoris tenuis]